jgi:DNA polymerase-3 subunit gamma/tau
MPLSYQALYRSWRPQTFSDLVGQPHVTQTLRHAVERGQVAHAYLFCGPRGTGKTSAAKVLAKAVNCTNRQGADPCNACQACRSIQSGSSVDVEEIDAASNRGVDEIRQLRDKVQYAPAELQRKVYIVDEVHMLTPEAFNALLKTLEEPPDHTLFVLATTEPHKVPATIISRCQRFDFRRIAPEVIVNRLRQVCEAEGWSWDDDALWKIADAADGGLRDALGLLEQTAAFSQGRLSAHAAAHVVGGVESAALLELITALAERSYLPVLRQLGDWYAAGKDPQRILHDILQALRDLFIVKLSSDGSESAAARRGYAEAAARCPLQWLLVAMEKLADVYMHLRYVDQPRLALETALLSIPAASGASAAAVTCTAESGAAVSGTGHSSSGTGAAEPASGSTGAVSSAASGRNDVAAAGTAGSGDGAEPASAAPGPQVTAARRAAAASRKWKVLQELYERSSKEALRELQDAWSAVLQAVRARRIQTYAWLMYGEPVLATGDVVVIAFASKVHREAVMKPDERLTIETALAETLGRPVRFLALVREDWETFGRRLQQQEMAAPPEDDLVARAVRLFGPDVVEVVDEREDDGR